MSFPLRDTQIRMSQCPSYRSNQLRAGHPRRPRRRTSARSRHTVAKTGRARSASLNIAIGASHPPLSARKYTTHAWTHTHTHLHSFPVDALGICEWSMPSQVQFQRRHSARNMLSVRFRPSRYATFFCEPRRCDGRLRMRMHFVCECVRTRLPSHARTRQPQVAYALPLGR